MDNQPNQEAQQPGPIAAKILAVSNDPTTNNIRISWQTVDETGTPKVFVISVEKPWVYFTSEAEVIEFAELLKKQAKNHFTTVIPAPEVPIQD